MSGGILEFLNELPESESLAALTEANSQRSLFVFKLKESPQPFSVPIETFKDRKAILATDKVDITFDLLQDVTLKFNVGTEIYFIKTNLKRYVNRVCFDMTTKVMQLKRRKEPRFLIPNKWPQTASFLCLNKPTFSQKVKCQVVDISLSGIRIEFSQKDLKFIRDEKISLQFQIYKRAEMVLEASCRFFMDRKEQSSIMGLEFEALKPMHQEKLASIIEDIQNFQIIQKK